MFENINPKKLRALKKPSESLIQMMERFDRENKHRLMIARILSISLDEVNSIYDEIKNIPIDSDQFNTLSKNGESFPEMLTRLDKENPSRSDIARQLGVSHATVYRYLKKYTDYVDSSDTK